MECAFKEDSQAVWISLRISVLWHYVKPAFIHRGLPRNVEQAMILIVQYVNAHLFLLHKNPQLTSVPLMSPIIEPRSEKVASISSFHLQNVVNFHTVDTQ